MRKIKQLTQQYLPKFVSLTGLTFCVLLGLIITVQNILAGVIGISIALIPFGLKNLAIPSPRKAFLYWIAIAVNLFLAILFLLGSLRPGPDQVALFVAGLPIYAAYSLNILFVIFQKKTLDIAERKPRLSFLVVLIFPIAAHAAYWSYRQITIPPPLVFLVQDNYIGPVFFFFDQPDGVDVKADPLGQAVWVPENGIVKLKASEKILIDEPVPSLEEIRPNRRAQYVVSVSKSGQRKILNFFEGSIEDRSDGTFSEAYSDEKNKLHKFPIPKDADGQLRLSYFPESMQDEPMVFGLDHNCRSQNYRGAEDSKIQSFNCGKFLVVSPRESIKLPKWMWEDLDFGHASISEFVNDANERVKKKNEYYTLSTRQIPQPKAAPLPAVQNKER